MATASVEAAVVAKLKATAAVNTPTGGRIAATLNTQEPELPFVVVTKLGAEGAGTLDTGSATEKRYTVQVEVYAGTEAEAETVGAAVRDALAPPGAAPWRDTAVGVGGAFWEDSAGSFDAEGSRIQSETFGIWFSPVP